MKHKFLTRMQNGVLALGLATMLFSCSKEEIFEEAKLENAADLETIALTFRNEGSHDLARVATGFQGACAVQTQDLIIGQKKGLGQVSIYKKDDGLYVTLSINDNDDPYFIAKSSLFVGLVDNMGIKKNPAPGKFPLTGEIEVNNIGGVKELTYPLKLSDYELGTLHFVLYAEVIKVKTDDSGIVYGADGKAFIETREGAWGEGIKFNEDGKGSWASYIAYDTNQKCEESCNPVFTGVSGKVSKPTTSTTKEEVNISYDVYKAGVSIGTVKITYNKEGNGNVEFTLTDPALSFEEIAIKVSSSTVDTDFSLVDKVSEPKDGKWKIEFSDKFSGDIFAAFYAKTNVCELD